MMQEFFLEISAFLEISMNIGDGDAADLKLVTICIC